MDIRVNIEFANLQEKRWYDSQKRSEHIIDRMRLRGIGLDNIKEAVSKGAKQRREDGSIITEFRWYKVVYREFIIKNIKKIYPITVIEI